MNANDKLSHRDFLHVTECDFHTPNKALVRWKIGCKVLNHPSFMMTHTRDFLSLKFPPKYDGDKNDRTLRLSFMQKIKSKSALVYSNRVFFVPCLLSLFKCTHIVKPKGKTSVTMTDSAQLLLLLLLPPSFADVH